MRTKKFLIRTGLDQFENSKSYICSSSVIKRINKSQHDYIKYIPELTNRELFRRDHYTCGYCLTTFEEKYLSRDYIYPLSKGGLNSWTNVITACRGCNQKKDKRFLHETDMQLYMLPYIPNYAEVIILKNRTVLADQMEFLKSKNSSRYWLV